MRYLFASLVFLGACAGVTSYRGDYVGKTPIVSFRSQTHFDVASDPHNRTWTTDHFLNVSNATYVDMKIGTLECENFVEHDVVVPARSTKEFLIGDRDRNCSASDWTIAK